MVPDDVYGFFEYGLDDLLPSTVIESPTPERVGDSPVVRAPQRKSGDGQEDRDLVSHVAPDCGRKPTGATPRERPLIRTYQTASTAAGLHLQATTS